ncbi:hypothetical protein [Mahella sp.]|uniref:hypothetical protein n=1 Tax=Mahella sp. TaxID=2798721 RepID=UPI0025B92DF5|nr:hypothetical protein [Mahella sp.]MBZ4665065.1 hypothetical protein [Mahella sp.]
MDFYKDISKYYDYIFPVGQEQLTLVGFSHTSLYGSFAKQPFDADSSFPLIIEAVKGR